MATKLGIYNGALRMLKETRLATVTDDVESRYILDDEYDDVLAEALQSGLWQFAMRTSEEDNDGTPTVHGFEYYFNQPTDFVRLAAISSSDDFDPPLLDYEYEAEIFYARVDPIYLRYVSNDSSYGGDLTKFPVLYERYVKGLLAQRCAEALTGNGNLTTKLERVTVPRLKSEAKAVDAMNEPVRFPPVGRFVQARQGNIARRRYDRA